MVLLPTRHLTPPAVRCLDCFRATSAYAELAEAPGSWRVTNWSWSDEPPHTVTVRSDDFEEREFILEEDGDWRLVAAATEPRVTPEAWQLPLAVVIAAERRARSWLPRFLRRRHDFGAASHAPGTAGSSLPSRNAAGR